MSEAAFWDELEKNGQRPALILGNGDLISYAELAERADRFAASLPSEPQLVAIGALNEIEAVAAYLGCLRHRHPVILLAPQSLADGRILKLYRPDWVYRRGDFGWALEHRQNAPETAFHPELAVLLSTSGTTGNPKLVRLSQENLQSNATAIASYLGLDTSDRAITSLNFYYSYGMAVLNSHLAAGACVLLTDEPVSAPAFWDMFERFGATHLPLVPYHFELLDRLGFADRSLPSLRHVTQAGGKLHAGKMLFYAGLAKERGWKFFVMYGQTEASPRMSFVPPEDILDNLDAIGRPVPGGRFALLDEEEQEIAAPETAGELVYYGPNVMLGYAETREDLAKPREIEALRTGDVAEIKPNGYFRIVGRIKRFIKLYGLRINLDDIERRLSREGQTVYCTGTDDRLLVFSEADIDGRRVQRDLLDTYNIQPSQVSIVRLDSVPLLPSGKVDYEALPDVKFAAPVMARNKGSVRDEYASILRLPDISEDASFQDIGGDSLAYLAVSLALEERLGYVPPNWEEMPIGELEALQPSVSRFVEVPSSSLLRLASIFAVVFQHVTFLPLIGGAYLLLVLSGHFFAKTQFLNLCSGKPLGTVRQTLARMLTAYFIVITLYFSIDGFQYDTEDAAVSWYLLFSNWYWWTKEPIIYPYWFLAAYTQIILFVCLIWLAPPVRRAFRYQPLLFGYVLTVMGAVGAAIEKIVMAGDWLYVTQSPTLLHLFAIGWSIAFSRTRKEKILTSLLLVAVAIFAWSGFGRYSVTISSFVVLGGLCTIWIESMPLPKRLASLVSLLSTCGFYIYLAHVIPLYFLRHVWDLSPYISRVGEGGLGFVVSACLGVIAHYGIEAIAAYARRRKLAAVDGEPAAPV